MKNNKYNYATCNVTGVNKKGKRQEIEIWMKKKDISILAIQETFVKYNTKEGRREYCWYLSGEPSKEEEIYNKKSKEERDKIKAKEN